MAYTLGDSMDTTERPGRKPTIEEAEAILTLVRGGWLKRALALDEA